jgi:hypothetical protein
MRGTPDRGAVGAFGPLKPTLADERLDFAVAQLDGHADQLGGASATGKALPLGGQTARQDVRSSRLRDSGQVVVHFLQSTHRRAFLRPPRREGFVRVLRGTKQTVSVRHRERMLIWWRETSLPSVMSVMSVIVPSVALFTSCFSAQKTPVNSKKSAAREGAK